MNKLLRNTCAGIATVMISASLMTFSTPAAHAAGSYYAGTYTLETCNALGREAVGAGRAIGWNCSWNFDKIFYYDLYLRAWGDHDAQKMPHDNADK